MFLNIYNMVSKAQIVALHLDYHRVLLVTQSRINALAVTIQYVFAAQIRCDYGGKSFGLSFFQSQKQIFDGYVFEHRLCAEVVDDEQIARERVA